MQTVTIAFRLLHPFGHFWQAIKLKRSLRHNRLSASSSFRTLSSNEIQKINEKSQSPFGFFILSDCRPSGLQWLKYTERVTIAFRLLHPFGREVLEFKDTEWARCHNRLSASSSFRTCLITRLKQKEEMRKSQSPFGFFILSDSCTPSSCTNARCPASQSPFGFFILSDGGMSNIISPVGRKESQSPFGFFILSDKPRRMTKPPRQKASHNRLSASSSFRTIREFQAPRNPHETVTIAFRLLHPFGQKLRSFKTGSGA